MDMKKYIQMFATVLFSVVMIAFQSGCASSGGWVEEYGVVTNGDVPKMGTLIFVHNVISVKPEVGPRDYYVSWSDYLEQEVKMFHTIGFSPFGCLVENSWYGQGNYYAYEMEGRLILDKMVGDTTACVKISQ